ncbi:hypothetical protein N0V83_006044 [Neocucurbitaria cava]|uniref:GmrSD restriction endonucleases N-terminal domain-containing protein n=1 Tax=Neocucurbitaria cava TaxID=798079 RepID=A0A9W8Y741_9PLEO|nr:hypothetical protein N0V83_006044 [Neocucurbitaria cava]
MEVDPKPNAPKRLSNARPVGDSDALQRSLKNEMVDDDDLLESEDDEKSYKPRPQLPKPFVVMRTLAHLMRDLESGIIDVDPEYQREVVWTADRMTGLVNSLMENFYIPPIILNKKPAANGNGTQVTLVCVDGKQRLSSVRAFIKGMIPCHDHRGEKWWFCEMPGTRRKRVLSEEAQKLFLAKEFVSFEFTDLSPEQEEDLFARVQMGVQLSLAEKMRASTGPWQELARLFVVDFPTIYSLMKDRARAKDFQLTLSCFSQILEVMHPVSSSGIPLLKTNYTALPKFLSNKGAVDDGIKSHLASVWNTFEDLLEHDSDTFTNADKYLTGVQTFAPVEMVAVAVLISMYSSTRNNRLLLGDIKSLRIALREHFTDLRLHSQVWKFVWEYLADLEAIRGAVDGSTVDQRLLQEPSRHDPAIASTPPTRRDGPSTRTNPRSILPPANPVTVKREQGASTPPPEYRSPKRKRTNPGPDGTRSSVIDHSNGTVTIPDLPDGFFNADTASKGSRSGGSYLESRPPPSSALHDGPGSADHQRSRITSNVSKSTTKKSTPPTPQRTTTSNVQTSNTPEQIAPPTPGQIRQSRISELNDYRAPTTSMGAIDPIVPTSQHIPTARMYQTNTPRVSPPPVVRMGHMSSLTLRAGIGAFTPSHTEKQWEGELESVSPTMPQQVSSIATSQQASSATRPSQSRPAHRPRKSIPRPILAQYDGAIDLTSDSELEQERQNLLSSFKGMSNASKPTKDAAPASVPQPAVPSVSTQRVPVVVQKVEAEDIPPGANPYARFKKNQGTARFEAS